MGFELEVEDREHFPFFKALKLQNFLRTEKSLPLFFTKEDGSLRNGFELVASPFTLNWINSHKNIDKVINWLKNNQFINKRNCGLHIHINKQFFSRQGLDNIRKFFAINANFLRVFSGRPDKYNTYCRYEKYVETNSPQSDGDRYLALNFQTDQNTIEIRIFASTTDYARLLTCIEFVDAISRYCNITDIKSILDKNSWQLFVQSLKDNKRYRFLYRSLKAVTACL